MSTASVYPCAEPECTGSIEIATVDRGTCPQCRLVELLDASTDRLQVDEAATKAEQQLARADLDTYLSTTPLPLGQDAPTFDPEAFERARERLDAAETGMASLRAYLQAREHNNESP
jgi:hypothetical protein